MDSTSITPEQAEAVGKVIGRQLRYLGKLRTRMERLGFPPIDPLYQQVTAAWDKVQQLHVMVHYLGCDPGSVGRR